jgi:tRNA-splicing ligase RtcB (3'-phosphate/5'-hydroxy nucleic acid ligase)
MKGMELADKPAPLREYIIAETPEEIRNLEAVRREMALIMRLPGIVSGYIMPDACPVGVHAIPVGCVASAKGKIFPAFHSADVCCSVMASNLGQIDPALIMGKAFSLTHFGRGGRKDFSPLPETLEKRMAANPFLRGEDMSFLAKTHLGTQGDGNHFLFVGIHSLTGETMLATHHGSRGFGAALYKKGLKAACKNLKAHGPKIPKHYGYIDYGSQEGQDYWEALQIVRDWTHLNHSVLQDTIARAAGASIADRVWNEHNFVFKEGDVFSHAKGATPMARHLLPDSGDGIRLIPLNMAQPILAVKSAGAAHPKFAPHGAGRLMSRAAHAKSITGSPEERLSLETRGLDIRFFSGIPDVSELPSAYKPAAKIREEIAGHGLGEIVYKILPYGSIMAGKQLNKKR